MGIKGEKKDKQKHIYLRIGLQVVVEDVDRNGKVPCVKGVRSVPALRTKLPPLCHHGMEVAQREQDALKLILSGAHFQGVLKYKAQLPSRTGVPPRFKQIPPPVFVHPGSNEVQLTLRHLLAHM